MKLHPKGEPTHWLPCGKCLGCREIQQQQLALRVTHEATSYIDNHFLTLTYSEEQCPDGLEKRHMQLFWKKIRRAQSRLLHNRRSHTLSQIKHLTCGEYGDQTRRPHYHAAALGLVINDLKKWDIENSTSETISNIWGMGIVTISPLTEDRINYVAGYVLKKAGYRKQIYCTEEGEELQSPYRDMSKGLGKAWIQKYQTDLRNGYLQHKGAKHTIPRYYMDIISKNTQLKEYIEDQKTQNWKELTDQDRKLLHTGEKIRQKEIREQKNRSRV